MTWISKKSKNCLARRSSNSSSRRFSWAAFRRLWTNSPNCRWSNIPKLDSYWIHVEEKASPNSPKTHIGSMEFCCSCFNVQKQQLETNEIFSTPHRSARNSPPSFSAQWPSSTLDLSNVSVSRSFAWLFWCPLNPQIVTIYHRHLVHKHGLHCPSIFRSLYWST